MIRYGRAAREGDAFYFLVSRICGAAYWPGKRHFAIHAAGIGLSYTETGIGWRIGGLAKYEDGRLLFCRMLFIPAHVMGGGEPTRLHHVLARLRRKKGKSEP